jgi:hypothetical protein
MLWGYSIDHLRMSRYLGYLATTGWKRTKKIKTHLECSELEDVNSEKNYVNHRDVGSDS